MRERACETPGSETPSGEKRPNSGGHFRCGMPGSLDAALARANLSSEGHQELTKRAKTEMVTGGSRAREATQVAFDDMNVTSWADELSPAPQVIGHSMRVSSFRPFVLTTEV
ncbi:hypothetical protein RRG08_025586 [Elysia crispata]|uniref:Uncharacterized protein n=1 Tax=Elysia crispata TaxID=231223 RepID=A0AAE0YF54_9GAST|nr:hypothetical protein RRG08_025586 [Elysia crispata]